jgi:hypothetical protein
MIYVLKLAIKNYDHSTRTAEKNKYGKVLQTFDSTTYLSTLQKRENGKLKKGTFQMKCHFAFLQQRRKRGSDEQVLFMWPR